MRPETSAPYTPSPLFPVLLRIFNALHCGAILLDETKRIARLSDRQQLFSKISENFELSFRPGGNKSTSIQPKARLSRTARSQ
jgi:hypothetical protein